MSNPIISFLRGDRLPKPKERPPVEQKFAPSSEVPIDGGWTRVNDLVYGAGIVDQSAKGDGNSAVFACLLALALGSIEAPLRVFQKQSDSGEMDPLLDHPLQQFLDDPNPWLDMLELRFWLNWSRHLDGNAYLMKVRSGNAVTGNTISLWPISPLLMTPWTEKGSGNFIDSYRYEVKSGVFEYIPVDNVIHFRLGIDDRDTRKGLAPIKRLVREIASDTEATKFADALLKNFGIPGLVVSPPLDSNLSREQAAELKERIAGEFGGGGRGGVGVLSPGAKMEQMGFSPEQLNLTMLHNVPEARICSVMGVHPAIAMMNVGLAQTANYASLRAVYEAFTERKLVPMWKMDEAKWNRQLKRDFTSDPSIVIQHDMGEVRALQEDEQALHERMREDFKAGVISLQESRRGIGFDADPAPTDLMAVPGTLTITPASELGQAPAPVVPALPPQAQPALPPGKMLEIKAGDLDRWPELMQGLIELAAPSFADDLDALADDQRRRLKRAITRVG